MKRAKLTEDSAVSDGVSGRSASSTVTEIVDGVSYTYMTGFRNAFSTEVLPGAVPVGRNTPRQVPYHLYTEQISGTAFTAPRASNQRTWMYRIQPSVALTALGGDYERWRMYFGNCNPADCEPVVDPIRWKRPTPVNFDSFDLPVVLELYPYNFMEGMKLMCHGGDPSARFGIAIYQYTHVAKPMTSQYMTNTDGDFLIVPCIGTLIVHTELGRLTVAPGEVCVLPRGICFSIHPILFGDGERDGAVGYVLETYTYGGGSFQLPELGPIGSNGLANARDFLYPVAWCSSTSLEDYERVVPGTMYMKKDSELFGKTIYQSPYNVIGWHGNYAPYKYNLHRFCAVNSVTYDHLDPSIYTVLTCPSGVANGTALADFVIFPARRVLATDANTLRPPWFHRNVMSEFMGLIFGSYDAKKEGSFVPGGASLHNALTPHGPDEESYSRAVADPCTSPSLYEGGMAFMFETCLSLKVAPEALNDTEWRDMSYALDAWGTGLTAKQFTGWGALLEQSRKQSNQTE